MIDKLTAKAISLGKLSKTIIVDDIFNEGIKGVQKTLSKGKLRLSQAWKILSEW